MGSYQKPSDTHIPLDRFPWDALGVSYIAEQAYCEKRVELWLSNPGSRVSIPKQMEGGKYALQKEELVEAGSKLHEAISEGAPPIAPEELRIKLEAGKRIFLLESGFSGSYRSIPLIGKPDAVCFQGLNTNTIIEYKVTDSNQLQMSHRVQLLIYGYLLDQEGFGTDELLMACALIPRIHSEWIMELPPSSKEVLVQTIHETAHILVENDPTRKNWYKRDLQVEKGKHIWLRVFKYERSRAERELRFFADFWLGARPAMPTSKERKCSQCLYNSLNSCSSAIVPYTGITPNILS